MLFAWLGFVAAGLVLLGTWAVAHGYLVVMHWSRRGLYLLERGADERYHLFSPHLIPVVLLRFLGLNVAYMLLVLQRRVHSWMRSHKLAAVPAKT